MPPDILYTVKASDNNEELRHSLRSLANLPHGKVFIAGYMPYWVNSGAVTYINTAQTSTKWRNSGNNVRAAVHDERLSDDFLLFNDDFFVMKPMDEMPAFHYQGSLDEFITKFEGIRSGSPYVSGARNTRKMLQLLGAEPRYSYELHVPMLFNKAKLQNLYRLRDEIKPNVSIHLRTLYGNYYRIEAEPIKDVKIHRRSTPVPYRAISLVSTSDDSFRRAPVGRYIREQFNTPSIYETPTH